MSEGQRPWKALKKWLPPTLTVMISVLILMGASWIHRSQNSEQTRAVSSASAQNKAGTSQQGIPNSSSSSNLNTNSSSTTSADRPSSNSEQTSASPKSSKNHTLTPQTNTKPAPKSETNQADTTGTKSPSGANTSAANHASSSSSALKSSTSASEPTNPPNTASTPNLPTQDVGFRPVSGGKVRLLSIPPMQSTTPSCVVMQYGVNPLTTWTAPYVSGPGGVKLTPPPKVYPRRLLVLPVHQGVLWAIVPATQFLNGVRGQAVRPTTLYYTPYPKTGTANLQTGAVPIAVIPVSAPQSATAQWTGWHVTHQTRNKPSMTNKSASAQSLGGNSTTSTENASGNAKSTAAQAAGTPTVTTSQSSQSTSVVANTGQYVYLQGLYQTSVGAVIVLSVNTSDNSTSELWTYLWNQQDNSVSPIAALKNGNGTYSWLAVANHFVYFATRHLLPPTNVYYSGNQSIMNVSTRKIIPIHLGTWVTQAIADGDNLDFQVKHTATWKTFAPDPAVRAAGSTG